MCIILAEDLGISGKPISLEIIPEKSLEKN